MAGVTYAWMRVVSTAECPKPNALSSGFLQFNSEQVGGLSTLYSFTHYARTSHQRVVAFATLNRAHRTHCVCREHGGVWLYRKGNGSGFGLYSALPSGCAWVSGRASALLGVLGSAWRSAGCRPLQPH